MADHTGSSMHQRRQYDAPGAGYAPQQQYYHAQPYMQYNGYQGQPMPPYQQQMPPQQWNYYNQQNYYQRPQPSYPPMSPYAYPQHNNYQPRQPLPVQSSYVPATRPPQEQVQQQSAPSPAPYQEPTVATEPSPSPPAAAEFSGRRAPYHPPLPWLSVPNKPFPHRQPRSKRRPRAQSASQPVELPKRLTAQDNKAPRASKEETESLTQNESAVDNLNENPSPLQTEASAVSLVQSDKGTVSSTATPLSNQTHTTSGTPTGQDGQKSGVVVPVIPNLGPVKTSNEAAPSDTITDPRADMAATAENLEALSTVTGQETTSTTPEMTIKATPKSWAALLRPRGGSTAASAATASTAADPAISQASDATHKRSDMLGHAVASFAIQKPNPDYKLSFLEPRGLINSGNMCYMNSVLQVLVFCVPFYNFLSHIGRNAAHSFKSETPLLDAMILFMREFSVIDAADSLDKLRFRLKPNELSQFGEPLLPEYVYDEIRRMPRFATMQRGHQQDAEEFLGFLFEELQGECARAIRSAGLQVSVEAIRPVSEDKNDDDGWLEVGPKQKAATTRSSGSIEVDTPINRIFGGQLRSELRVPGAKNSVTLEPYQSLQLDIGSPEVRNITDALRGLTKPETLHGDFHSPRGAGATATKQVFVESLPSVLILHLKRFQYDNTGGTQKIWKKIGYPLELEIPKEAFPHAKRGSLAVRGGLPKYRLISVIYHHGKSATAGHYTTDILRQDEREWLRVDDTFIQRVRSQDVEAGSEEDPKVLAAALEQHRRDEPGANANIEDSMATDDAEMQSDKGWSQAKAGGKKWSGVVNGTAKSSGRATPVGPQNLKDNKVAYILFYEKIET